MFIAMVALRMPALSCASVGSWPSRIQVHDLVVGVGNGLDQVVAGLFGRLEQVGGNLFDRVLGAHGLVVPEMAFIVTRSIDAERTSLRRQSEY